MTSAAGMLPGKLPRRDGIPLKLLRKQLQLGILCQPATLDPDFEAESSFLLVRVVNID